MRAKFSWTLWIWATVMVCLVTQIRAKKRSDFSIGIVSACNCHGKATKCYFDRELYDRTGHGGVCIDCADNTEGVNCEKCKPLHYRDTLGECVACSCSSIGSLDRQCNDNGQCPCKPGISGRQCDHCATNYFDFSPRGCRPCGCHEAGVAHDSSSCDPEAGKCPCKDNVEGQRCDRCKAGFFDLQAKNEFGCVMCFCFGHSTVCNTAGSYYKKIIESNFAEDDENWKGIDFQGRQFPVVYDADLQLIEISDQGSNVIYFLAPECYLGDQRLSYNQQLGFTLRIGPETPRVSIEDVIIEGSGIRISVPITAQGNSAPSHRIQNYKFRLHEHPRFSWTPRISGFDFMKILSNITTIKIRAIYSSGEGVGYLDNVILDSARQIPGNYEATWVESCSCPEGHIGRSCESCAPGYKRDPPGDNPFHRCVKCSCYGHSDSCDPVTGQCICQHNTVGHNCEECAPGYYGDARRGTAHDCRPCLCPDRGACVLLPGGQVACQECPFGHTGHQCDLCIDGYYGDPLGRYGPPRPCRKCDCNDNVDPNAVGNCNTTSGECLKCIYNTAGSRCERCRPGYYGSALTLPKGNCKRCTCYLPGTVVQEGRMRTVACEPVGGQCHCKQNIIGRRCENCRDGFWNIDSERGCEPCHCNRIGSVNQTCDLRTGQCHCHPGITGRHCDKCLSYHYGFSEEGCTACDCDPTGSLSLQCDTVGQCQCRPNREDKKCNICKENKYSRGTVCIDCPPCYDLLDEAIESFRLKLEELAKIMEEIENHPVTVDDLDFQRKLREVMRKIDKLVDDAHRAAISDGSLIGQLNDLRKRIRLIQDTAGKTSEKTVEAGSIALLGTRNITVAEDLIRRIQDALKTAINYMDSQGKDAWNSAQERSDKFGQQSERMSQIAREARHLADIQEKDAEVIESVSDDALNTSSEAYRLAREAIESQERLSTDVQDLAKSLDETADFLERTKKLSEDSHTEAKEAYENSLDVYTDSNSVIIPEIAVQLMKTEAHRIIGEAGRIKGEAEDVLTEHGDMLQRTDDQIQDAHDILEEAIHQQQITDEQLADVDAALAKAQNAVAAGEKVLGDAKDTLKTLRGFDQQVQESKDKSRGALRKVPEIKRMIQEAEDKTGEAEDALSGAIQDAIQARDIAQEAQKQAEQASKDADEIRGEADQTRDRAIKLRDQAEDLAEQVIDTDKRMKGYEDQANNDGELSRGALERANQAKSASLEASKKAKDALDNLEDILSALGDLDEFDDSLLAELERRLAIAEREMTNADLDARTKGLREERNEQHQWMRDYESEIEQLKKDVANVAAIRKSLPEDCYRRLVLEP